MREHGGIRLVEHLESAPAEFARVAVVPDERAHELQERLGVALLLGDVDVLGREPASVTGRGATSRAVEKPPFLPAVHCIGVRTDIRPSISMFSPIPISSP